MKILSLALLTLVLPHSSFALSCTKDEVKVYTCQCTIPNSEGNLPVFSSSEKAKRLCPGSSFNCYWNCDSKEQY